MSENQPTLEEVVEVARQLSPLDKVRLVEQIMVTLEQELKPPTPKRSLYGLWSKSDLSGDVIDEARRETWANFPREDV